MFRSISLLEVCSRVNTRFVSAMLLAGVLLRCSPLSAGATTEKVSYARDIAPILKRSCNACHRPDKRKGDLDLTSVAAMVRGGKNGPAFVAGAADRSQLIRETKGPEPSMPKDGDPLNSAEVALIERWIQQGAPDDTPAGGLARTTRAPETYAAAPAVTALTFAPDGALLAVAGYHEVLLHKPDGSGLVARLAGGSSRIESLAFSPDGSRLAVSGSAPGEFGEVQIWSMADRTLTRSIKATSDSLFGVSFSPDATRVAFGGADKVLRVVRLSEGRELFRFDQHTDWVLATAFTLDGKRVVTGGRDKSIKLVDADSGKFVDEINKPVEAVLCLARHPKREEIVFGGDGGTVRTYKIPEKPVRTEGNDNVYQLKELDRLPGPVQAIAYSPSGDSIAVGGSSDEARIYKTDGARVATLKGHQGAIFAIAFRPDGQQIVTGGLDGHVRFYDAKSGKLVSQFVPVPLRPKTSTAAVR